MAVFVNVRFSTIPLLYSMLEKFTLANWLVFCEISLPISSPPAQPSFGYNRCNHLHQALPILYTPQQGIH